MDILDASGEIDGSQLAQFEWFFLPLLANDGRPPRILHQALATEPAFFCQALQWAYRPKGEAPAELSEEEQVRARLGDELLNSWHQLPGMLPDGSINAGELAAWVVAARELAHACSRGEVGDLHIGYVLVFAPKGLDDAWPHEAIRDLIEELRSENVEQGLATGIFNSRGVMSRSVGEGGDQEWSIAQNYRDYARRLRDQWPRTARLLVQIAQSREAIARSVDTHGELEQDLWR